LRTFSWGHELKIHLQDGLVSFGKGSLGPRLDKPAFLKSPIGEASEVIVANGPYATYRIRPEPGITASAAFENDRLNEVSLLFDLPSEDGRQWTEELELERKKIHDQWLLAELGKPPYRYSWGEVVSSFDPKGCVSDIILRYAR
jgi:hypothetical protein